MKHRFDSISNFGQDLMDLVAVYRALQDRVEFYRLKAALYKAYFYHNNRLSKQLENQIDKNRNSKFEDGFDGFCYDSRYTNSVYRTLEGMLLDGVISNEEYEFCNI